MFKTILFELKILEINSKIKYEAHLFKSLFLARKRLASPVAKPAHSAEPARLAHLLGPSSTSRLSHRRPSDRLPPLHAPPSVALPHSDGAESNHRPAAFPLPH
jgi:hypothetical protein